MRPVNSESVLKKAKIRAFLVSNLTNIRYLSGVEVSAGLLLVRPKGMTVFVDSRYTEAAQKEVREGVDVAAIDDLPATLKRIRRCGVEAESVTLQRFASWKRKFKNTKFVQKEGIIEEFRRSKSKDELRHVQKAQRITHELLARIPGALKRGVTEKAIAEQLRRWSVDLGADGLSFDPIVAFGKNSSRPHHHPGSTKLARQDIVQVDVGARIEGYCADQSAVFFVGKPTEQQQQVYSAVERAKDAAIAALKPGVTNHVLDSIARKVLAEEGLEEYFTHSLGHGVGLDIHEGISLSKKAPKTRLLKNEIVTIEPGVYIPGKFGIRLEEEVVV